MAGLKNRAHAILSLYGIHIHATDIFGRNGLKEIEMASSRLSLEDRFVLNDLLLRINELKFRENIVEEEISRLAENNDKVKLLMTITRINVYSATQFWLRLMTYQGSQQRKSLHHMLALCQGRINQGTGISGSTYPNMVHQC